MTNKTLSPGDITDSHCTSCRTIMNHTIVSMINTRPARVQCNTCHGVHNYRPEKTAKTITAKTANKPARQPAKRTDDPGRQDWAALKPGFDMARAIPYHMQTSFKVGNLMNHPKFGLGVVRHVVGTNKVEVLFEEGLKLLRCN